MILFRLAQQLILRTEGAVQILCSIALHWKATAEVWAILGECADDDESAGFNRTLYCLKVTFSIC